MSRQVFISTLVFCFVCVGCTYNLTPEETASFFTGEAEYEVEPIYWEDRSDHENGLYGFSTTIDYSYTNNLRSSVFVKQCGSPHPPKLQKWQNGSWETVYSPVVLLCKGPPHEIEPGETYNSDFFFSAGIEESKLGPNFGSETIEGDYRLVWQIYKTTDFEEEISIRHRVSNRFELSKAEPFSF